MFFEKLANLLNEIEPLTSRIEIRNKLKSFFLEINEDYNIVVYLLQSELFLPYEGKELNVGQNILEEAIARAYGFTKREVKEDHLHSGDLGKTALVFAQKKKQKSLFSKKLTIKEVYLELRKIAEEEGKSSVEYKLQRLIALLNNASPLEAKYIVKIILGTLRVSLGTQTIIEAITLIALEREGFSDYKEVMHLFKEYKNKIERKYSICYDLGKVVDLVLSQNINALENIKVEVGIPVKSALAEREKSAEAIIKRLGKCIVEGKYDGFRLQVHHKKGFTKIFSRRAENLTNMFPEFVELFKDVEYDFIFDSEAIGYNVYEQKYLSFQETIKRKRKYNVEEKSKEIPVILHVFDVLYYNKETINLPLKERRKLVEELVAKINNKLVKPTEAKYIDNANDLMSFFNHCVAEGLEGIIAKDLSKPYMPGLRDFAWIKLKKNYLKGQFDSVDLVVMGYFLGKGKYADKPSSLLCGVYDPETNTYKAVAKVASGLTEEMVDSFSDVFKSITLDEKPTNYLSSLEPYKYVLPKIVLEVVFDEITKSPLYDSGEGYSLRFPRVLKIRTDKSPESATTEKELKKLYELSQ